jgi:integrating conjugative element protein (TIGR03749 family)
MKVIFFILLSYVSFNAIALERVAWSQGQEIFAELKINTERKILFPEKVRFAIKPRYKDLFSHSIIDNVFYITAKTQFNEKVTFQGLTSSRFYILQMAVSETSSKSGRPLSIQLNSENSSLKEMVTKEATSKKALTPIDLVQFASQSLYSKDEALIESKSGIKAVNIKKREIPNFYRGASLNAFTLAGWSGGGLYVTAVKLVNLTPLNVVFNPCNVRGEFYSSTPQFNVLYPANSRKNFTVVYMVSKKPFDISIKNRRVLCV